MTSKLHAWCNEHRMVGDRLTCVDSDATIKHSGFFQCSSGYYCGGTYVSNPPRYYVWINDVLVKSTSNYTEAYSIWKNRGVEVSQVGAPAQMVGCA